MSSGALLPAGRGRNSSGSLHAQRLLASRSVFCEPEASSTIPLGGRGQGEQETAWRTELGDRENPKGDQQDLPNTKSIREGEKNTQQTLKAKNVFPFRGLPGGYEKWMIIQACFSLAHTRHTSQLNSGKKKKFLQG